MATSLIIVIDPDSTLNLLKHFCEGFQRESSTRTYTVCQETAKYVFHSAQLLDCSNTFYSQSAFQGIQISMNLHEYNECILSC